jgi:hypothetical protein
MGTMEEKRLRIGEILIEAGVLDPGKLREALELQREQRRPLGQILVESSFVTEAQLIQALSRQLSVPWVSLWHVDVAPELLSIVSREDAEKFRLLPIYARTVRGERPALFVAMDDPTYQEALDFVRQAAGMEVRPMIAAPTDLRQAIRALYAGEEEEEEEAAAPVPPPLTGRRSSPPPPPSPTRAAMLQPPAADRFEVQAAADAARDDALELTEPAGDDEEGQELPAAQFSPSTQEFEEGVRAATEPPPAMPDDAPVPPAPEAPAPSFLVPGAIEGGAAPHEPATSAPPDAAVQTSGEPQGSPAARGAEVPAAPPRPPAAGPAQVPGGTEETPAMRRSRRALAFTFLDGTSIAIGSPPSAESSPLIRLAELIRALRHYSDDPNVPEPYGPRGLSRVVAALLEILARKALLTETELAEAIGRLPQDR